MIIVGLLCDKHSKNIVGRIQQITELKLCELDVFFSMTSRSTSLEEDPEVIRKKTSVPGVSDVVRWTWVDVTHKKL